MNVQVRVRGFVRLCVHAVLCAPLFICAGRSRQTTLMAWTVIVSFRAVDAQDNGDRSRTSPLDLKRRVGPTVNARIYCFY